MITQDEYCKLLEMMFGNITEKDFDYDDFHPEYDLYAYQYEESD